MINNRELTSRQAALLLAISIVGILLRIAGLGRSYWFDELATLHAVNVSDWLSVVKIASEDNQPPLYNSTVFFWTSAFGYHEIPVRLLSLLYGLLALFTPWLARTSLSRTQKIVIFTVLCLMPLPIRYAQEARNYSLLLLMSSACLFLYYEILAGRGKRPYLLFHVSLILLAFSHLFGLMLAVSFLAVMFWRERRATGKLGLVVYAAALSAVIVIPLLHGGSGKFAGGNFWITFSAAQLAYQLIIVFTPAGLLLLAYALVGWRRDPARQAFDSPLIAALMPFVLMLVGSILISLNTPIVTERNLIGLIPAFALLIAWLLQSVVAHKSAAIACLLLCLLLGQAIAWTFSPYLFIQQDFRSIAQQSVADNSKVCYLVPTTRDDSGEVNIFAFYVTKIYHRPDLKPELMAPSEVPQDLSTRDCRLWADAALPKRGESVLKTLPQFNGCANVALAKPASRLASELVSCKP